MQTLKQTKLQSLVIETDSTKLLSYSIQQEFVFWQESDYFACFFVGDELGKNQRMSMVILRKLLMSLAEDVYEHVINWSKGEEHGESTEHSNKNTPIPSV